MSLRFIPKRTAHVSSQAASSRVTRRVTMRSRWSLGVGAFTLYTLAHRLALDLDCCKSPRCGSTLTAMSSAVILRENTGQPGEIVVRASAPRGRTRPVIEAKLEDGWRAHWEIDTATMRPAAPSFTYRGRRATPTRWEREHMALGAVLKRASRLLASVTMAGEPAGGDEHAWDRRDTLRELGLLGKTLKAPQGRRSAVDLDVVVRLRARGWSHEQIAKDLGTTRGTVSSMLHRAGKAKTRPPKRHTKAEAAPDRTGAPMVTGRNPFAAYVDADVDI